MRIGALHVDVCVDGCGTAAVVGNAAAGYDGGERRIDEDQHVVVRPCLVPCHLRRLLPIPALLRPRRVRRHR